MIPEYIVVHSGRPDDPSAPNYWVRFKDYIKNVACSEIYSISGSLTRTSAPGMGSGVSPAVTKICRFPVSR